MLAVIAGRSSDERERLVAIHVRSITSIVEAAAAATLEGRRAEARALAMHASRLCGELAGLWPAGSNEPLA